MTKPLLLLVRQVHPDEGEDLRLVILDQTTDTDLAGLVITSDGTARLFTWPDGEEAETVSLQIRTET